MPPAQAAAPVLGPPIIDGLAGPLQIAVGDDGNVLVGQDFAGVLTAITKKGQTTLAANPGGEIAGVAPNGKRGAVYTTTNAGPQGQTSSATLSRVNAGGQTSVVADLLAYEAAANPDQVNTYGFSSISADCAQLLPPDIGPPSYTGQIDSHPYAIAEADDDGWYIAEAAGNTILWVGKNGQVRTVAVLPPQPLLISAAAAAAAGLPACTVGLTYNFEPVPTDVEVGRGGQLYVTTLPGGPETPALGARGSVYAVNPWNGSAQKIASGLAGATNLAIGDDGTIYVAELFAGQISQIIGGAPQPFLTGIMNPAGVEYSDDTLYVSYDVFASGKIAKIALSDGQVDNDGNGDHGNGDHGNGRDGSKADRQSGD